MDVMVTARMSAEKKERASRVLAELGTNASQVINRLYDLIIETRAIPFSESPRKRSPITSTQLEEARLVLESIKVLPADNRFATMTDDEIREERLRTRGYFDETDPQS